MNETDEDQKDPDWLESRCRKKKFRKKHVDICRELCGREDLASKLADICTTASINVDEPPMGNIEWENTNQINSEDEQTIISEVINGIKDIVMKKNEETLLSTSQITEATTTFSSTTAAATTGSTSASTTTITTAPPPPSTTTTTTPLLQQLLLHL